jgi:hypothetical protein
MLGLSLDTGRLSLADLLSSLPCNSVSCLDDSRSVVFWFFFFSLGFVYTLFFIFKMLIGIGLFSFVFD